MNPSPRKILRTIGRIASYILVIAFVLIEFIFDYQPLQYLFYGLISLYILLLAVRAFKGRKTIAFQFELGTQTILSQSFDDARERLRQKLDLHSKGYPIGFLHIFTSEFSKIDHAAQSEPSRIDKIVEFAQVAFPFQNILVSIITDSLQKFTGNRFFRISLAIAADGDYLLHANSRNEKTPPIFISQKSLNECIDEAASRISFELNGAELTHSFESYYHYNRALELWSEAHSHNTSNDSSFNRTSEEFHKALDADPSFILAALYLAALHSIRHNSTAHFDQSKKYFDNVLNLCEAPNSRGSKDSKKKIKGLVLTLTCNLTNQWLHRIGKYDDEEIAESYSIQNRQKAKEAIKALGDSPLAYHEYAFSMHSMESTALANTKQKAQLVKDSIKAIDLYTKAINFAQKKEDHSAERRSSGNRAYVMTWLAALLRHSPDPNIRLKTFSSNPIPKEQLIQKLYNHAEEKMLDVATNSKSNFGNYALANLCHLYCLNSNYNQFIHSALILNGISPLNKLGKDPQTLERAKDLNSAQIEYIEGANDISAGLLAGCTSNKLPQQLKESWLTKALQFHKRSFDLIKIAETNNLPSMRIRIIKQMTNVIKLISHLDPNDHPSAPNISQKLLAVLNDEKRRNETIDTLTSSWLEAISKTFQTQK